MFVSYASVDRPSAEHLVSVLQLNGIDVWWDQFDLRVGDEVYIGAMGVP
jgi:hypothetical protein